MHSKGTTGGLTARIGVTSYLGSRGASNTSVSSETEFYDVDFDLIANLSQMSCDKLGIGHHQVAVTFVDSDAIQSLNHEFRNKNVPTDVLSFPQEEFNPPLSVTEQPAVKSPKRPKGPPMLLGDVVISLPETEKNARNIGQGLDREACFLLVHGLLHLCGHDHETPEEESAMLEQQRRLMAIFDNANPPLWAHCVRKR